MNLFRLKFSVVNLKRFTNTLQTMQDLINTLEEQTYNYVDMMTTDVDEPESGFSLWNEEWAPLRLRFVKFITNTFMPAIEEQRYRIDEDNIYQSTMGNPLNIDIEFNRDIGISDLTLKDLEGDFKEILYGVGGEAGLNIFDYAVVINPDSVIEYESENIVKYKLRIGHVHNE